MRPVLSTLLGVLCSVFAVAAVAQDDAADIGDHSFKGLELRGIGPAITSGRISDFAFH